MSAALWEALLQAQQSVEGVRKDGTNKAQHYSFVTAESVMAEARHRLHPAGLVLTFSEVGVSTRDTERVDKSTGQVVPGATVAAVTLEGVLVHAATGDEYRFRVSSEGADYGDKAVPKAYTNAVKYGCRHLLLIPFGDDPEETSTERGSAKTTAGKSGADNPGLATEKQAKMLYAKSKDAGLNDDQIAKVLAWSCGEGVARFDDVPRGKVDDVVAAIEKAKAQIARNTKPAELTEPEPAEPAKAAAEPDPIPF